MIRRRAKVVCTAVILAALTVPLSAAPAFAADATDVFWGDIPTSAEPTTPVTRPDEPTHPVAERAQRDEMSAPTPTQGAQHDDAPSPTDSPASPREEARERTTTARAVEAAAAPAPAPSDDVPVSDLTFDWGLNDESNGGAYAGGCNFLSAGIAGDTGTSRTWSLSDGFYSAQSGNTTIVRPTEDGSALQQPTWVTRCQTPSGASVNGKTSNAPDSHTQTRVQIAGGSGTANTETNSAEISWTGSFTVAYYGGFTYWSATDPKLSVTDGAGVVTATLSGYAADMDDPSIWNELPARTVTLATLSDVRVTTSGLVTTPGYLGVAIPDDVAGRNPQAAKSSENASWWGAFPADFLRFQMETGQSSYWFTTDGGPNTIQPRKVASPLIVTGDVPVPEPESEAPVIVEQPTDVDAKPGATAVFSVGATGHPAPAYQWQHLAATGTWEDVATGGTDARYSVKAAEAMSGTRLRVIVRNEAGRAVSDQVLLTVTSSDPDPDTGGETPAGPVTASGALFDWGINNESNGGAYFGVCNFLSAGTAGDTGSSRLWSASDGFYRTQDGNTTIVRPRASGSTDLIQPSWDQKCTNPDGGRLSTTSAADSYSQTRVRISGGTGTFDPVANTAEVSWTGSFTAAYYGGMTYWSAANPRLVVNPDGTGTVTVTASGYGSDMDDATKWSPLAPRDVVIANLSNVKVTASGFSITPDYLGVSVPADVAGRNAQTERTAENESWWGAFPAEFVRFQVETGQSSYWFTTGGSSGTIQPRKVTLPLTVCATSDCAVPTQTATGGPAAFDLSQNSLKPPLAAPKPAVQAAPVPAEEVVVMLKRSGVADVSSAGLGAPTDDTPTLVAAISLILALGLLTLVAGAGGGLFATGTLGGPPRRS